MSLFRNSFIKLFVACLFCWANLIPFRLEAIPLWVFAGSGVSGTGTPGPATLLFWLELESNANDSSSNAYSFTPIGTVAYTTGRVSNGIDLDSTEYLNRGDADWQSPEDFTIALWHKPDDATPTSNTYLVSKYNTSAQRALLITLTPSGTISVVYSGDGTNVTTLTTSTVHSDGAWFSIIFTFEGGATAKVYINGVEEDSDTAPANIHNSTSAMSIGTYSGTWATGMYDSVAMFSKAFNTDEVAWFHNSGNGRAFADL